MGTRSSRLQEEAVATAFAKDGIRRDSCRRIRNKRPTSLMVDFSGSFDQDSEVNRSRSEEGSDSEHGRPARADRSHGDLNTQSHPDQTTPLDETSEADKPANDGSSAGSGGDVNNERLSAEETGRVPHRTFSERLPSSRHTSGRSGSARAAARARSSVARPVSEAWIGVYRVNSRHGMDILTKDSGECSICLEDLLRGETIARLACLCVYHKSCIDSWCKVKPCCPEHPFD
ncbi:hypothetical protein JZ751_020246 [Albula glossodonta]|uniref:RING-type E3 ubiquitin transferase n=1 Tax=Albula glossodonta TaxID=121402 RepID=A0A8T2N0A6_9TELE|nr:hypothetical protein JZ751_020246 [Albula glossodonta]